VKQSNRPWWQKKGTLILVVIALLSLAFILLAYFLNWTWVGFSASTSPSIPPTKQYLPAKTVWDWLQLLIIPTGLAVIAVWFNHAELYYTDFSGANLGRVIFHDAKLIGADLSNANLTDGILTRADLSGANLTGANLTNVKLGQAVYKEEQLQKAKGVKAIIYN
jgi:pentapeptide repeat protein